MRNEKVQPIPGSKLFRVHCVRCGDPMRVNLSDIEDDHYCQECAPHRPPQLAENLTKRQAAKLGKSSS